MAAPAWVGCRRRPSWSKYGVKPDGSLWDPNMNSFCHLTFGSVAEWLFGYVLGIRQEPSSGSFRRILPARLKYASASSRRPAARSIRASNSVEWQK